MSATEYVKHHHEDFVTKLREESRSKKSLAWNAEFNTGDTTDLTGFNLAVVGIKEDRLREVEQGCNNPDAVREAFYKLIKPRHEIRLIDLGNIEPGNEISDTYFALKQTLKHLHEHKITVIILGGMPDLAFAQYTAYESKQSNTNVLIADSKVEMLLDEETPEKSGYVSRIITHQPNYLFNITHIGHQSYFVEPESYDAFERMNFDMVRLGNLRNKIQEVEPLCRNANLLAFNLSAIRGADAPGQFHPSPNGFSGEEACQISRYAGMSNELNSAGFYGYHLASDNQNQTAQLLAQMVWYFVEGFSNRKDEYPAAESNDYLVYRITFRNSSHEIVFYKNTVSDRWWMEVPYPKDRSTHEGKFMVPCSYSDYQTAMNDEIPDRWVKAYHKL